MRKLASSLLALPLLACLACGGSAAPPAAGTTPGDELADGFYRILRLSEDRRGVEPVTAGELLLVNDYEFLDESEKGPPEYTVVRLEPFVPLLLGREPRGVPQEDGRLNLDLQLAPQAAGMLEEFSRRELGQQVALVIGGEIATRHKVREVITGDAIQITRCTDDGCEYILARLKEGTRR